MNIKSHTHEDTEAVDMKRPSARSKTSRRTEKVEALRGKKYSELSPDEKARIFKPGRYYSSGEIETIFSCTGVIDDRPDDAKRKGFLP
jgi:hypothetical protein